MDGKFVVGHVAELVVELREKKLNINDKTVTDTSDSMFLLKLMDFSEKRPLARRRQKGKYPHGPHAPPKGTQGHIAGVRTALMSKMRKIAIAGGFWECDCRVWYIYRHTDKQMHNY